MFRGHIILNNAYFRPLLNQSDRGLGYLFHHMSGRLLSIRPLNIEQRKLFEVLRRLRTLLVKLSLMILRQKIYGSFATEISVLRNKLGDLVL
jgi:hypothetical protein